MGRLKGIPSHCKDKTYKELYGKEKAEIMKIKQKLSIEQGKINCKYCGINVNRQASGQKYCKECAKQIRNEQLRKSNLEYSKRPEIIEKRKIYIKEYYNKNKEKIILNTCEWQKKPQVIKKRIEREKSPERITKRKDYRKNNLEKLNNWQREYCRRPKSKSRKRERDKEYRNNPEIALKLRLRDSLKYVIRKRANTQLKIDNLSKFGIDCERIFGIDCERIFGIDCERIIEHLKPFPKDISKYHIDHIRPLASFVFINKDGSLNYHSIKQAFAPENHQWLLKEENIKKGSIYNGMRYTIKNVKPLIINNKVDNDEK